MPIPKKKIQKLVIEIQNLARERGHTPDHVAYTGRSTKDRGERALVTCTKCQAWGQALTRPQPNQIDISGPLIAVSCHVATKKPRPIQNQPLWRFEEPDYAIHAVQGC